MANQIISGVALFILGCATVYLYWVHVARRLTVIQPGRVYQSGEMRPAQLLRAVRRLHIDTVIDFRGESEMPLVLQEQRALQNAGIRHANIPSGTLPTEAALRRFIEVMHDELGANRRVLMHCKDGEGRAVAFAAVYRMEMEGWSPLEAYRATTRLPPALRFLTWMLPFAGRLSRSNAKSKMILSYSAGMHGRAPDPAAGSIPAPTK